MSDPCTQYAEDVISGKIVAGPYVRAACKRHLRDLAEGAKRGLTFDVDSAERIFEFFSHLVLPDADKPFTLSPWQHFVAGSVFGWRRADGRRRFRTAYVETGKGSGKTPFAAGIGLYGLMADGEIAAEIYPAATSLDQARILFNDAKRIAEASPMICDHLEFYQASIAFPRTMSSIRAISAERRGLDGKRVYFGLIDELHEHRDDVVVEKVRAGFKGRDNPLLFEITNSGYNRESVCWRHHELSCRIVEGTVENDEWFAYVCALDEGDDWKEDKACWIKANPSLGTTIKEDYLESQVALAKQIPAQENLVARLNFCVWTEQADRAISMEQWAKCTSLPLGVEHAIAWRKNFFAEFAGAECYGGLDIGAVSDLTALVLVFKRDKWILLPFFWVPESTVGKRARFDRVSYDAWVKQGFMITTNGAATDYGQVCRDIVAMQKQFSIEGVSVDTRFQGQQLSQDLVGYGLNVESFGQGFADMVAPCRAFLERIADGVIEHGNNPVLNWQAGNVAAEKDRSSGQIRFTKGASIGRIDGIIAAVMGMARAEKEGAESWYRPGMLTS